MVKSVVKSFLPKNTVAEKRENARKTEILRAFGGRLMRRSHAPKCGAIPASLHPEMCKIFNFCGFSVSGQICGQNNLSVFFWKGKHSKKAMFTRTFLQCLQALSEFCSLARSALLPAGASPPPACSQSKRVTVTLHPDKYVHAERAWTYYIKTFIDCQYQAGISLW